MPLHTYHKTIKLNNQLSNQIGQSRCSRPLCTSQRTNTQGQHTPPATGPDTTATPTRGEHGTTRPGTRMKARSLRTQQCTAPPPPDPATPHHTADDHDGQTRTGMIISVPQLQGTPRTTTP